MGWEILPGWYDSPTLLAAVRTLFAYTERMPDRATGWLYLQGQPPVTAWPPVLAEEGPRLLTRLKVSTGFVFTACCFQAYLNGSGVGWHHDRSWGAQAILSLGVSRTFGLRHATGAETPVVLHHGDLLYMAPGFQDEWEHCVPVEQVKGERCSLVFRTSLEE